MTIKLLKKHLHENRLENADLSGADLRDITCDGLALSGVSFNGACLRGANFSDAVFSHVDFTGADLTAACFADARFVSCDFTGALFGATIITGAHFCDCRFASISALTLPFAEAANITACLFEGHSFNRPPLVLLGLPQPMARFDLSWLRGLDAVDMGALAAIEIGT